MFIPHPLPNSSFVPSKSDVARGIENNHQRYWSVFVLRKYPRFKIIEINRIAKLMQEHPELNFEVQGHCDNTGSDKVNDPLSQQRAEVIVAALVKQGIASDRLTAVGKGSHSPIADNTTAEGRAKNRRVEFVKK